MSNWSQLTLLLLFLLLVKSSLGMNWRIVDEVGDTSDDVNAVHIGDVGQFLPADNDGNDVDDSNVKSIVRTKCTAPGMIALTFDDGPSPYTSRLLDTLKQERVNVTFFVLGAQLTNQPSARSILQRSLQSGHLIGSHSQTHPDFSQIDSAAAMQREFDQPDVVIGKVLGRRLPLYFRFPYGEYNQASLRLAKRRFSEIVQWNLDTEDWKTRNSQEVFDSVKSVVKSARPDRDSFIILMHDTYPETVDAVPTLIRFIKRNTRFRMVTIDECLGVSGKRYRQN